VGGSVEAEGLRRGVELALGDSEGVHSWHGARV
jgi:hypothetical protein